MTADVESRAILSGEALTMPTDLYIPPDALKVFLEAFEGPLDLLLYLIRRQNVDILQVQVAVITEQYIKYIGLMQTLQLDLAGDYLVMAALLTQIKSQKLLPQRSEEELEDEEDPRLQLLRQLQIYERFQRAAENLEALPKLGRDFFSVLVAPPPLPKSAPPEVNMTDLYEAFCRVLERAERSRDHEIKLEPISMHDRMSEVARIVTHAGRNFIPFAQLCAPEQGRLGVIVTFLALLELLKEAVIEVVQSSASGPIQVRMASGGEAL